VPEHLAAWEGGRREPEDEEEDDEGGDESDSVHGKADQVLTLVEHYEVLWRVGFQQEEKSWECDERPGQDEKKGGAE